MFDSSDIKSDGGCPAIEPADIQGLMDFPKLRPLLDRLHSVGTECDKAKNRTLHIDQSGTLILLWLFSPVVDSLRGLQQVRELDKVRRKLGVSRASLGSLSESVTLFDPEPRKQIAEELPHELPVPGAPKFDSIDQTIAALEGSVVNAVVDVARLAWLPKS